MSEIKARTTMYKGIKMRSRLEADFAAFLDGNGADWDYEPVCFAGPGGQWLPDFRIRHGETTVYFEIKPESFLKGDIDPTLEKMAVAWLTEPGAILQLTVWTWGDPAAGYSFMGIPPENEDEMTWWCGRGPDELTAWVGMGQLERTIERQRAESASMTLSEICRDEQGITALVSSGDAITACGITPERVWWCECGTKVDGAGRYVGPGAVCGHLRMVGMAPAEVPGGSSS